MWVVVFAVLTIGVRLGLAVLAAGSVDTPAEGLTVLRRAAVEMAAATVAFWVIGAPLLGASLLRADRSVVGFDVGAFMNVPITSDDRAAWEAYAWASALIGGGVVAAATAGRAKRRVGLVASVVLAGVMFPIIGHWVWAGWLRNLNVVDFGGLAAIHLPAATFALVAAGFVGRRPNASREPLPPQNEYVHLLGVGLVVVGWFPYLLGGTAAHPSEFNAVTAAGLSLVVMNTALAGVGGLLGGLLYSRVRRERIGDRSAAYCGTVGLLGGLVAVSAACVACGTYGALLIGVAAGMAVPVAAGILDRRIGIDDPSGLVAVHGFGSVWGLFAAAAFAGNQAINRTGQGFLLANQSLMLAVVLVTSVVAAIVTFGVLRAIGPVRESAEG